MSYQTQLFDAARANTDFRRVLSTSDNSQLVLMSVLPGEDIGLETHDLDQVLVFVEGTAETWLDGKKGRVGPGDVVVVPAGTEHNFVNDGQQPLKLFTIYAPPEHPHGTVHRTKAEAEAAEAAEHAAKAAASGGFTVGSLKG